MVASDAFIKVINVINNTGLWDAKFTWYPLSITYWICPYGSEYRLGIHVFLPTWPYLIIKVLATWSKFLKEPSGYCTLINCAFTFCTRNVIDCFYIVMALFKLLKHKFPKLTMFHIHLCGIQIIHWGKQSTTY